MKTVENRHIKDIIELSEEGMSDTVYWDGLEGRSDASPYDFFVEHFAQNSDFEYDTKDDGEGDGMWGRGSQFEIDFGHHTDWENEWEIFWSAFFNSAEDLNSCFWRSWGYCFERIEDRLKKGSNVSEEKLQIVENYKS